MVGICKLCLQQRELIKRSHLFPNFMYSGIPDEKNRMYIISSEQPNARKTVQTGALEEYMLCSDCDNRIIGQLERYASNNLYRKDYLNNNDDFDQISPNPGVNIVVCKSLNYSNFKLFLETLLWRASISSHSMFKSFKLSDCQEEQLRDSIYRHDPLNEDVFPCVIMTSATKQVKTDFVVVDPTKDGLVKFYINEFVYTFYLSEDRIDQATVTMAIRNDNTMVIVKLEEVQWNEVRFSIITALKNASKPNLRN